MYTEKEIEDIRDTAAEHGLFAPKQFWEWSTKKLSEVCNGCGAESSPEWFRNALTWLYRKYPAGHCIHDVRFELSDGTRLNFETANEEFNKNNLIEWKHRFGAARYIIGMWDRIKIRAAYNAVRSDSGWDAWIDAYNKNKGK